MKKKAAVLLADGFEEIEAITPIDILRRAGADVTVVGVGGVMIKGSRDISIKADREIGSYDELPDAVIVPGGGRGADNLSKTGKVGSLLREAHKKGKIIAAICAGPAAVLLPLGILDGRNAACYPGDEKALGERAHFKDEKVVVDGNVITSRGPATAMAFALAVAEALCGKDIKETVSKKLLYEK